MVAGGPAARAGMRAPVRDACHRSALDTLAPCGYVRPFLWREGGTPGCVWRC